jgi:trk system potassium uptake protein TrkA
MKIVIAGAGEVGFHIAEQLILEKKDVVIIEKDIERSKFASNHLDCLVVNEDATNVDILREAGISKAAAFISATDSDEVNMISCYVVGSEFSVPVKIARVRSLKYTKTRILGGGYGVDFIVNPEIEAAKAIVNNIQHGVTSDIFHFNDSDIQLRDIFIDDEHHFVGKNLRGIKGSLKEEFIVAGILREGEVVIPDGGTVLQENDHVFIVATVQTFDRILAKIGMPKRRIRTVVIAGAGRMGRYVTENLLKLGKNVKIVDRDYERCKKIAADFPGALVINGDISDKSVFDDEQLSVSDLIVTTTSNEELNILAAIYAKSLGIKKAIALVNKTNYLHISSQLGLNATVSPKISSVNAILKYMRRGNILNVFKIFDGRAEVTEFSLTGEAELAGKALKDTKLPQGSLVVAVTRDHKHIIPDGNFVLQEGDRIVTFSAKEASDELSEMFSD